MTAFLKKYFPVFLLLQFLVLPTLAADQVQIRPDAPDRYVVVEGDTLWDISGRFLEDPWRWPEIWELNPQIENPHLIYPGDVVELVYSEDGPMLTLQRGGASASPNPNGLEVVKLSPQVRREAIRSPIPAIPLEAINALLSGNAVVTREELDNAPYLLRNRDRNVFSSDADVVFAKGNWDQNVNNYEIVRAGKEYKDPETGALLGYEAILIGAATILDRDGDNATLRISDITQEVREGDHFIPKAGNRIDSTYFPAPPSFFVRGRIVDIVSGKTVGGSYDTLVINKGRKNRIQVGNLLALQKPDIEVEDNIGKASMLEKFARSIKLSRKHVETFDGETYGSVLIYRVFENSSFGIILDTNQPVRMQDKIVTP